MTHQAPSARAGRAAWLGLFVLVLLYMIAYLDRQIFALMVDPMKRDLHISEVQIGIFSGVGFALFYGLVGLPIGWLADRFSRRGIIFVGMAVWSLACAACGLAGNFSQLMVARFALGAGEGALVPAGMALLGESFPRSRMTLATNIFKFGALLGGVASGILGGLLMAWATKRPPVSTPLTGPLHPWQLVLLIVGLPGVVLCFLAFLLPKKPAVAKQSQKLAPIGAFIGQRKAYAVCMGLGGALLAFPSFAGQVWGATFLLRHYHLPYQAVGALAGVGALGSGFGFFFFGWLSDFLFRRGVKAAQLLPGLIGAPLLMISNILAFVVINDIHLYVPMLVVNGFLSTCVTPLDGHIQICTPGASRSRMAAIYGVSEHVIAVSIAPALVAVFTQLVFHDPAKIGWAMATTTCIAMPLAMIALAIGLKPAARAADQAAELAAKLAAELA